MSRTTRLGALSKEEFRSSSGRKSLSPFPRQFRFGPEGGARYLLCGLSSCCCGVFGLIRGCSGRGVFGSSCPQWHRSAAHPLLLQKHQQPLGMEHLGSIQPKLLLKNLILKKRCVPLQSQPLRYGPLKLRNKILKS